MDKLRPMNYNELLYEKGRLCKIIYIILHNIYIAQNTMKFVHGDLHLRNIMRKEYNEEYIELYYSNEKIMIKNTDKFIPVINDFGFSSLELKNGKRLVGTKVPAVPSGVAFDPDFDHVKLLGSILLFYSKSLGVFLTKLFTKFYMYDRNLLFDSNNEIKYTKLKMDGMIKPLSEVMSNLLKEFEHEVVPTDFNYEVKEDTTVCYIESKEGITISNGIQYKKVIYDSDVIPKNSTQGYFKQLKVHYVEIENDKGTFENICCKQNTLDNAIKKQCVVINGTYFDPKGKYSFYSTNSSINHDYVNVVVNNNGIDIKDTSDLITDISFNSAPLLVKNGIPNNLDMFKKRGNIYLYSCIDDIDDEEYRSCSHITPGQLCHLANPNPRSIIATKGDKTYFICIEGRIKNFGGATYEQMVDFLMNYLQVDNAINLDGGSSISLMWNINGQVYSPIKYPHRKTLSNIISFNY